MEKRIGGRSCMDWRLMGRPHPEAYATSTTLYGYGTDTSYAYAYMETLWVRDRATSHAGDRARPPYQSDEIGRWIDVASERKPREDYRPKGLNTGQKQGIRKPKVAFIPDQNRWVFVIDGDAILPTMIGFVGMHKGPSIGGLLSHRKTLDQV
jgi:hypothetical protein